MKISALEEYGLRCMMQLGQCVSGQSMTITEIAERESLSVANVRKLMMLLRETGLVVSVRGRSGGYMLENEPASITVGQIMESLAGRLLDRDFCKRYSGGEAVCAKSPSCTLRSLWGVLDGVIGRLLSRMTLAELIGTEAQVKESLHNHLRAAIDELLQGKHPLDHRQSAGDERLMHRNVQVKGR